MTPGDGPLRRHYAPKHGTGWPHDEGPRVSVPDRVLYGNEDWNDDKEWEVIDIQGRWWFLSADTDFGESPDTVWAPVEELHIEVWDDRRVYGPRTPPGALQKLLEDIYVPVLREQLEQTPLLLRYLERD